MNLGIIAASMPAMPHFFAKSSIFRASTYNSLRRLLNKRDPPSVSWFGGPLKGFPLRRMDKGRGSLVQREDWTELQTLPEVHLYRESNISQDTSIFPNARSAQGATQMVHEGA